MNIILSGTDSVPKNFWLVLSPGFNLESVSSFHFELSNEHIMKATECMLTYNRLLNRSLKINHY